MQNILLNKEPIIKENRHWVRISAACNNICIFCLDSDAQNGKLIIEEEVIHNIRKGFKYGTYNRIIISGGEASINPKFPEYIRYAKELGYQRIQTVTNGNMFANESFCKKVFDIGLQEVTFSFHGHHSLLHDYLVATPGAFKKSLRGLIYIKKYYPNIITNIDIVVNKVNIKYLPDIVTFFMKLGVSEFDLLQIIPFGRGFRENKIKLFYDISKYIPQLHATWKLSRIPGMVIWTNRFPIEVFEGFEDLIQDPRKIKSEVTGEMTNMFSNFINSNGIRKPDCFGERCDVCFIHDYCHNFLQNKKKSIDMNNTTILNEDFLETKKFIILRGEESPEVIINIFGPTKEQFIQKIKLLKLTQEQELINIPRCIRLSNNNGKYEYYNDMRVSNNNYEEYTEHYIKNLYRKKSLNCISCKYNKSCEGIHINFIRTYGFSILKPI